MYLRPMPRKMIINEEDIFFINFESEIHLTSDCNDRDFHSSIHLQEEIEKELNLELKIKKVFKENFKKNSIRLIKKIGFEEEEYKIRVLKDTIEIIGSNSKGIFYGVESLVQIIKNKKNKIPFLDIEDKPYFKNRGYYHDVTRGKVPTLKTLKELVDKLSSYKINQLQLYIEHSFAYEGFSEVWFDKDPLTAEEILELDSYCKSKYIELVPSIAIFGHLYEVLRTESFKEFCELGEDNSGFSFYDRQAHHTLDVSNPKTIEFVRKMILEFLPLFTSNKFNIGCDETFDLGKGKSKTLASDKKDGELYVDFLNEIIKIVKGYDKEIFFWGDVILRYPKLISKIDEKAICLNWNYCWDASESDTKIINEAGRKQYLCPGVAGWSHFMNLMDNGYENIKRMISYGKKYSTEGILTTDWGDYGHINLLENSIPLMIFAASASWNPDKFDKNEDFKAISFLEYDNIELVFLLEELGKCQSNTWYEIVRFKEKFNSSLKEQLIEDFKNLDYEKIRKDYFKALEVKKKLYYYLAKDDKNKIEYKVFLNSAEAIAIFNDVLLHLLKNSFDVKEVKVINDRKILAEKLELWFFEYRKLWREKNKESELIRIAEIIKYLCKYLRKI